MYRTDAGAVGYAERMELFSVNRGVPGSMACPPSIAARLVADTLAVRRMLIASATSRKISTAHSTYTAMFSPMSVYDRADCGNAVEREERRAKTTIDFTS
jgi:hypothetical protein